MQEVGSTCGLINQKLAETATARGHMQKDVVTPAGFTTNVPSLSARSACGTEILAYMKKISRTGAEIARRQA